MRFAYLFCMLFMLCAQVKATPDVVFFNPGKAQESFWGDVDKAMSESATLLGIKLEIFHSSRDRLLMIDQVNRLARSAVLPKYVVLVSEEGSASKMLKSLYGRPVYVALMLNDISKEERAQLKQDTHWQKYLLPAVVPDNYSIGHKSASALVDAMSSETPEVVGISGDTLTPASLDRTSGAVDLFQSQSLLTLHQVVYGNWREDSAYWLTLKMLKRYPELKGIWTANDHMAFGVLQALEEQGIVAGKDIFVSTVNTSEKVLRLRQQGKIAALGGGHFLAGAVVMDKIAKHHHSGRYTAASPFPLFSLLEPDSEFFAALLNRDWKAIISYKFCLADAEVNLSCNVHAGSKH
ncbi:ABC transporter substrate-binding protein [Shewanella atlantica]|uniref:Sugar ABC transporter substrate-binding protein n=1 Tax=Shewanella atlantica TaxID=271099 RepID=A0A3S0L9D9_9GAMM|nr:ABC transporter substrate-binding protein [Shewanella atlantica]RTR30120.1 sugar ABC transporter substrate-binding protein [Shewanella atlantica]